VTSLKEHPQRNVTDSYTQVVKKQRLNCKQLAHLGHAGTHAVPV